MNKLFLLTTVLSTMSTQLIAASGTRGGGHIVQIKQERYLMDMASAAVCDWKRGEELFNDYPELNTIFDELNKIEWYFASELKQELKGLDFCFTGSLRSVSPYDWYSPVGHNRDETIIQGGYRIDNDVYFDKKQLTKISKYDQAMFMIHETMHSFLPMDILERNLKLRTITRVIGRIGKGKSVNTKDLYFNMYKSEVSFPRMLNKLKDYKKQLIFLNASKEESMEMVLNSNNPESLIDFNYLDFNAISEKDYNELYFHMDNVKLRDVLTSLIINGNPSVIKKIIDEKSYANFNIILEVLNIFEFLDESQKQAVLDSKRFSDFSSSFDVLNSEKQVLVRKKLLTLKADSSFQLLGEFRERNLIDFPRIKAFPSNLKWVLQMAFIRFENGDLKDSSFRKELSELLELKHIKNQVLEAEVEIEREKKYVLVRLNKISNDLIKLFKKELRLQATSEDEYQQILNELNL